jgi:hypothetical protein
MLWTVNRRQQASETDTRKNDLLGYFSINIGVGGQQQPTSIMVSIDYIKSADTNNRIDY